MCVRSDRDPCPLPLYTPPPLSPPHLQCSTVWITDRRARPHPALPMALPLFVLVAPFPSPRSSKAWVSTPSSSSIQREIAMARALPSTRACAKGPAQRLPRHRHHHHRRRHHRRSHPPSHRRRCRRLPATTSSPPANAPRQSRRWRGAPSPPSPSDWQTRPPKTTASLTESAMTPR